MVTFILAVALTLCWRAQGRAQQSAVEPIYRFDPTLSIESPQPSISSAGPPVKIDKLDREVNVRLETEGAVAPYLGAGGSVVAAGVATAARRGKAQAKRRLPPGSRHRPVCRGQGFLSLGYRFNKPPSLLDENRNDPLSTSGDVHIKFDIKVPFD